MAMNATHDKSVLQREAISNPAGTAFGGAADDSGVDVSAGGDS